MVVLFVSFGAKRLIDGGSLSMETQTLFKTTNFFSKLTQTPQFVYFIGLLSYPLEGSLSKTPRSTIAI
jgi:hypothetical protein